MAYTVRELAKLSGVSVRTLHWYDEVGLLSPAYHGANGYRYYEEEQLLLLQQILFFRELGFKLHEIQDILKRDDFNKTRALRVHKGILEESLYRTKLLIETIEITINHLKGKKKMGKDEYYVGLNLGGKKSQISYLAKYQGTIAEDLLEESLKQVELSDEEKQEIARTGHELYKSVAECMEKGLGPRDEKVQALVARHYQMCEQFHTMNKGVYNAYAQLYNEREEFRKQLQEHHAELPEFMAEAMRVYAYIKL